MTDQKVEPWTPGYRVWFKAPLDIGRDVVPGWQLGTVVPAQKLWESEPNDIFVKLDYPDRVVRVVMSDPEHLLRIRPVSLMDSLAETPVPPLDPENPSGLEPSPYAGTTELPPNAGVRHELFERGQEHRKGGMFWGAPVTVHYASPHQQAIVTGRILDFVSVPAPHIVIGYDDRQGRPTKMILFTTVITSITPAEDS